jgi:adenine-specific DNA-methyltransferase
MSKEQREKVASETPALHAEAIAELCRLFPSCVTEGKVDFDALRLVLGDEVDGRPERYSFSWAGKRDAIRLLQMPSRATLAPRRDESINFDTTEHLFIEGDNLEALKLLYKPYAGRVKMIYIDPPYNTGKDFIYPDNYADPLDAYLRLTGQKDENGNHLTSNPDTNGRKHSAWLSMMYPRLLRARQLLRDDGVIFVSIDDHEVHSLRMIMNEVFGEENFIAQIAVQLNPRGRHLDRFVARTHEYVMVFARDANEQPLYALEKDERMLKEYNKEDERGRYRELELRNRNPAFNSRTRPNLYYPIFVDPASSDVSLSRDEQFSVEVYPRNSTGGDSCWTWGTKKFERHQDLLIGRQTTGGGWRVFRKDHLIQADGKKAKTLPKALWLDKEIANDQGKKSIQELFDGATVFDFPKAPALVQKMIQLGTEEGDIVLDFFAGSGVTAHAVLAENQREGDGGRRFILVQLPEPIPEDSPARKFGCQTIADITKERTRRVIAKLQQERDECLPSNGNDQDLGFRVFKLAESNFRQWVGVEDDGAEAYADQMDLFENPLRDDADEMSVIYEVAIKEGYGLNSHIERMENVPDNAVYRATDPDREQSFLICLDETLHASTRKALELSHDDLFVCRDKALDDTTAANLALQCRLKTL